MATWNDFPTEIKLMVINEIDPDEYDLLDFRLANKECNELSKKRFAQTYFTVRRHFVGKKSFQALVDISKDEFFGPRQRRSVEAYEESVVVEDGDEDGEEEDEDDEDEDDEDEDEQEERE
ncbi:hypothetical protein KCU64_g4870, partial [Aureobasidium melanogenum]